jgi:Asp-tRNA(Asn)/Glu-tRNA(Gln) amidotransferase A subunit family amidase
MRALGKKVRPAEAVACRDGLGARVLAWFGDADAWLTPTVGELPPRVGAFDGLDGEGVFRKAAAIGAFTAPFNVSGQPASSIPAGRAPNGLPIGVQIVGRPGGDRDVLALSAVLEAALGA